MRTLKDCSDELHEVAMLRTGFDDFGDPIYRRGQLVLLEAFDTDMQLTESGSQAAYDMTLGVLIARLYTEKGWAEYPEVLSTPIRRPIVIMGLPRSGTTALHRLLCVDTQLQGLETWLSRTPMMRPPRDTWEDFPEYRDCVTSVEALSAHTPNLRMVHDTVANEVEECAEILMQNFVTDRWPLNLGLSTYARWVASQSTLESYRRYIDVLRLIGARDRHKRWVLKANHHMPQIDTLLNVLPDACIIQTHRDPLKAIPSKCSLAHLVARRFEGEAARPDVIGERQCAYWRAALDRIQAARRRSPKQFFDVDHRHFLADPLRVIHSIYEYFGLILTPEAEQRMRKWIAISPTTKHGKHEYSIDSWGIAPARIRDIFSDYRAQHQFQ